MNAAAAWQATLEELSMRMTAATFATWLADTRVSSSDDHAVTVAVGNHHAEEWLDTRLRPIIERTASRHFPPETEIRFEAQAGEPPTSARQDDDVLESVIMEAVREEKVQVGGPPGALGWTDFYIKLKVAFRKRALAELKGAPLSTFLCLALHVDRNGVARPGIEAIMRETGYSRPAVCSALDRLESLGLIVKQPVAYMAPDAYTVTGYAWFGQTPAPAMWEEKVGVK